MTDRDDLLARWRAERRQPEPPDAWGRVAFWLLAVAGTCLAAHVTFSLVFRRPPEQPIERLLTPAQRVQIEECKEIGKDFQVALGVSLEGLRGTTHPYLHEAQRARLALALRECGRDVERMR